MRQRWPSGRQATYSVWRFKPGPGMTSSLNGKPQATVLCERIAGLNAVACGLSFNEIVETCPLADSVPNSLIVAVGG